MMSFKHVTDATDAGRYFEADEGYYTKDDHLGEWQGNGAAALDLVGPVDNKTFKNLLEGKLPNGQLLRKTMSKKQGDGSESKERPGIDFTFSAPKSVSIAALVSYDLQIIKAHDDAVKAAVKFLESKALGRKHQGGVRFRQKTNSLVAAAFRHDLSRANDPQLHTHAVVMNITQRDDGNWISLTNDDMMKSVKLAGAVYRAELARNLQLGGYPIRSTRDGFEMASVSDEAIKIFKQRSDAIEARLDSMGMKRETASTALKQGITLGTRPHKHEGDRAELRQTWTGMLKQAGIELKEKGPYEEAVNKAKDLRSEVVVGAAPSALRELIENRRAGIEDNKARRGVDFAIEHLSERQGIFTSAELLERAMLRSLSPLRHIEREVEAAKSDGRLVTELPLYRSAKSFLKARAASTEFQADKFRVNDESEKLTRHSWVAMTMARTGRSQAKAEKLVDDSIAKGRLVRTEERFTTGKMLATEQTIMRLEEGGRGAVTPIKTYQEIEAMFADSNLNAGQKEAASLILTTQNRYVGIQGYAGTGKSHMLSAAVEAIKAESAKAAQDGGFEVIGIAPYASQNKALAELGMQSQTLASFLLRLKDQERLGLKSIVFLDESSVVPAHQMETLMQLVEGSGARMVLIGDKKQTQAVEAGKPFEQLQNNGLTTAHLTEVQRQKTLELKAAVVSAAGGQIEAAVRRLSSRTVEVPCAQDRHTLIAGDYVALSPAERNSTLIVAGTNAARHSINSLVREKLNLDQGELVNTYVSVDMTRAEKREAGSYTAGQVLMLEGSSQQRLEKRKYYAVETIDDTGNKMILTSDAGDRLIVNVAQLVNLSVFEKHTIDLTQGDWIRITRNNTDLGLSNGERYQVSKVTADAVHLDNGATLSRTERLHLQHGYATTVHSAQGLTTSRVLIDADTQSLTSNRAVFYVAISRPRTELKIYAAERDKLVKAMAREPKKYSAMDLRTEKTEAMMLARLNGNTLRKASTPKKNNVPRNHSR